MRGFTDFLNLPFLSLSALKKNMASGGWLDPPPHIYPPVLPIMHLQLTCVIFVLRYMGKMLLGLRGFFAAVPQVTTATKKIK